jgi:hypothetical protein
VKRDLYVCLSQAARTYDFDRLRWAGVRLFKDGKAAVLTSKNTLPELVYEKPAN